MKSEVKALTSFVMFGRTDGRTDARTDGRLAFLCPPQWLRETINIHIYGALSTKHINNPNFMHQDIHVPLILKVN